MRSVGDGRFGGFVVDVTHSTALKEGSAALWLSQQTKPCLVSCNSAARYPIIMFVLFSFVVEIVGRLDLPYYLVVGKIDSENPGCASPVTLCLIPEEQLNED